MILDRRLDLSQYVRKSKVDIVETTVEEIDPWLCLQVLQYIDYWDRSR